MGVWYNLLKEIHTCKMPKADPNIKRYILFSTYHYKYDNGTYTPSPLIIIQIIH